MGLAEINAVTLFVGSARLGRRSEIYSQFKGHLGVGNALYVITKNECEIPFQEDLEDLVYPVVTTETELWESKSGREEREGGRGTFHLQSHESHFIQSLKYISIATVVKYAVSANKELELNPFTPEFKKYILPTFLKRNVWVR